MDGALGAQWRVLPDDYGTSNSVFRNSRRLIEKGAFDALLEPLAEMVERDSSADVIDSTVVQALHSPSGLKRGLRGPAAWPVARRLTNKLHARCDGHDRRLASS